MTISAQDAHPYPIYNARFRLIVPLLDADGDPVSPSSPDTELSQDLGTFADATNEATEIATSSGVIYVDLIATEMDTKSTVVRVQSTGAKTTVAVLNPRRLPVIRTGTAQAGGNSTITLDASASAIDDYYVGCWVNITNDTPSNVLGQARVIIDYVGSTKVATIQGTWGTNPSSSSTFEILLPEGHPQFGLADLNGILGTAVSTPATAGILDVNVKNIDNDAASASGTVTFPNATLASTTNITAGTIATATNVTTVNGLAAGVITAASIAADAITAAKVADGTIDAATFAAGAINAAAIAADAIGASELAADAVAEIADGVWDEAMSGHVASGTYGQRLQALRTATAQAGAAGTVTLDASASASDDFYKNALILITGGTGANQVRTISGYVGSTKVASITPNWVTNPSSDSVFVIIPAGSVAGASAPTAAEVADAVWDELQSGHTTAATFGRFVDSQLATIQADTDDIQTRIPAALVSGRIDASVGAIASGAITAASIAADAITAAKIADSAIDAATFASGAITATAIASDAITAAKIADGAIDANTFASGAITAAAIAADAIGASELAADAVTEIQSGLATSSALTTAQADLDDIQTRLPAALTVGGNIKADALALSGDTVAADNAESFFDGTGYGGTNNVIPVVTTVNGLAANTITAAAIAADAIGASELAADAVTEIQSGLATGSALTTAQADLDDIQTRLPAALVSGRMDSSVGAMAANTMTASALATDAVTEIQAGLSTLSAANVNAEVVDALTVDVIADSIPADGSRPTIAQALIMITRFLMEKSVSSTTVTVKKEDGSTSSMTFTLDSATDPSSITRAS